MAPVSVITLLILCQGTAAIVPQEGGAASCSAPDCQEQNLKSHMNDDSSLLHMAHSVRKGQQQLQDTHVACAAGWTRHGEHCYQRQAAKYYDAAQSVCESLEGYLAVPNSEAENTFLKNTMNPSSDAYTWLGFDYDNEEKWEDGSSADSTASWRVLYDQHDAADRVNGEPVVFIRANGAWSFDGKSYNYPYICEKAATAVNWVVVAAGKLCRGDSTPGEPAIVPWSLKEVKADGAGAGLGEWYFKDPLSSLAECKQKCVDLRATWGCKYISYASSSGYCYVHQDCTHQDNPGHTLYTAYGPGLQDLGASGCTSSGQCGQCQGDCDNDGDCTSGLYCFQRDSSSEYVPGCVSGGSDDIPTYDYCTRSPGMVRYGSGNTQTKVQAEATCAQHGKHSCSEDEVQAEWSDFLAKPGNSKNFYGWLSSGTGCILHGPTSGASPNIACGYPETNTYKALCCGEAVSFTSSDGSLQLATPATVSLDDLGAEGCQTDDQCDQCQGDCDVDNDCKAGLYCFQRYSLRTPVPGCVNGGPGDITTYAYCIKKSENGVACKAHQECVTGFCAHWGVCAACSECTTCAIGVGSTCGNCGSNYPSDNSGPCHGTERCACENPGHSTFSSCKLSRTCTCNGKARLGYGSSWSAWQDAAGSILCSSATFGADPNPGQAQECQCQRLDVPGLYTFANTQSFGSNPTAIGYKFHSPTWMASQSGYIHSWKVLAKHVDSTTTQHTSYTRLCTMGFISWGYYDDQAVEWKCWYPGDANPMQWHTVIPNSPIHITQGQVFHIEHDTWDAKNLFECAIDSDGKAVVEINITYDVLKQYRPPASLIENGVSEKDVDAQSCCKCVKYYMEPNGHCWDQYSLGQFNADANCSACHTRITVENKERGSCPDDHKCTVSPTTSGNAHAAGYETKTQGQCNNPVASAAECAHAIRNDWLGPAASKDELYVQTWFSKDLAKGCVRTDEGYVFNIHGTQHGDCTSQNVCLCRKSGSLSALATNDSFTELRDSVKHEASSSVSHASTDETLVRKSSDC